MYSFKILENDNKNLKILGFELDIKGNISKDLWPQLTKKIQKNIQNFSARNLSFKGKILIAKSLLVSKIWYTAYLLPPSRKQLNTINTLISNWTKNNSHLLPRYSIFQLNLEHGGLSAPILRDILDTRLTSIWLKLLSSDLF